MLSARYSPPFAAVRARCKVRKERHRERVWASGKLGIYMVQHALDRGYAVIGVCRERSVEKLDGFHGRIAVIPGATNDREVIKRAVAAATACSSYLPRWAFTTTCAERL